MGVVVVTDSTADIAPELIEELGIHVVPLKVIFGTEEFIDGTTIKAPEFYRKLEASSVFPTTSQPSPGEFVEKYREISAGADGIVSIHISAKLSGTYDSAIQARDELAGAGPEIRVIDGKSASMGTGLTVLAAARAARDGASLDEVAALAESLIPRTHVLFLLDTLEYLKRGGRIGKASAFIGTLLKFHPLLGIVDGEVAPIARPRSKQKGVSALLSRLEAEGRIEQAAVIVANDQVSADGLSVQVATMTGLTVPPTTTIGPVIGAHAGPGLIGVAYTIASN
ncbi:MAG: DegV family protein [Chloroflexi bacterium]|nr:DegV family protein [Chloroflexota bacterium]